MKKKILIIIIVLIAGLILFSEKINNIEIIENIKQNLNKQNENISQNVTIVDITDLKSNINIEHEHIYITKYDENNHWEECKICHADKKNIAGHTYTSSWTMGTPNNCSEENLNKFICKCGYSYKEANGRIGHQYGSAWNNLAGDAAGLVAQCQNCSYVYEYHKCKLISGEQINCGNLGVCKTCGYNYRQDLNVGHHDTIANFKEPGIIKTNNICYACNTTLCGKGRYELQKISNNEYRLNYTITLDESRSYAGIFTGVSNTNISLWKISENLSGNTLTSSWGYKIIGHLEGKQYIAVNTYFWSNGSDLKNGFLCTIDNVKEDYEAPTIEIITKENQNEWVQTKQITISGTENYCGTVKAEILNEEGKSIYEGNGIVTNQNYSITFTPEIEADEIGKTFTVIVTDNCGNSTQQEFTIAKIDSIPPTPTSETKVEENWAQTKKFKFKATDEGIGNVQIAFNDIKDLKLANYDGKEYSREYEFTGDVYSPKELSVLYKDELGNTKVQKITVDKLDNTAPRITNVNIHNNKLSVTANDTKEGLGEGSGVTKYRFITSSKKLENPEIIGENSTEVLVNENITIPEIYKVKYIYIVAEDLVGNASDVYEFEVPQLKLTSKANTSGANGKGVVELDWSDYDLADKYFVIYRKQENESKWETAVTLEQKLTSGKYTDTLANDKTKPSTPSIDIEGNIENNNIQINQNATDSGTKYQYYIEAYDITDTTILLTKSNIIK